MRYYKKKQANMLGRVALFLKNHREILIKQVPALGLVIPEYLKMEDAIYRGQLTPLRVQPTVSALQKMSTREAFEQVVMKLASAAMVAAADTRQKKQEEKNLTVRDLKKLPAEGLCAAYEKAMAKVKKIRNPEFYGITADYMADAQAYYKEFRDIKASPAKKKKELAEWNKNLDKAVSDAIKYLKKKLDPLIRIASDGDANMAQEYKAVRTVQIKTLGRPSDQEVAYRKSREKKKEE